MVDERQVTRWIERLKTGDRTAAEAIWEDYSARLIELARKRLAGTARRMADEEDVVLSAFDSFCRGVAQDRFPRLDDRDDLWRVLVVITVRKAHDQRLFEQRQKRGGREPIAGEDALLMVESTLPSPELEAEVNQSCERLLSKLKSPELRQLALWRLAGYSTEELAAKLDCVPRTIERKLRLIRAAWEHEPE